MNGVVIVMFAAFALYVVASEWRRQRDTVKMQDQLVVNVALVTALNEQQAQTIEQARLIAALKQANEEKDAVVRTVLAHPAVTAPRPTLTIN